MVFESSSLAPIREMVKLFSKIHLWRWIHGFQVIISGAFTKMVQRFSSSHLLEMVKLFSKIHLWSLLRWCSVFQRFISRDCNVVFKHHLWRLYRDGAVFFKFASLGDGNLFFKFASLGDGEAFFKDSSLEMDTWFSSCLLYTSPSPRDRQKSRMPSSA